MSEQELINEVENIFSDKVIKNVLLMSYQLDKLDGKLDKFAEKYGITPKEAWAAMQKDTSHE